MRIKDPDRYQLFAEYYYALGSPTYKNITRSAVKAGYSKKYAWKRGQRLLATVGIQKALEKKRKQIEDYFLSDSIADTEELLQTLTLGLRFQPKELEGEDGKLLPLSEIPDKIAYMISGMKVKERVTNRDDEETVETTTDYKYPDKKAYAAEIAKLLGLTNGNKEIIDKILERLGAVNITVNHQENNYILQPTNHLRKIVEQQDETKDG